MEDNSNILIVDNKPEDRRALAAIQPSSRYNVKFEKRQLKIIQLDKLDLISAMALGIAHEIRNPMTTVRGYLQFAKKRKNSLSMANIDLMIGELDRANSIITEFLYLAKNKNADKRLANLQDTLESLLPMLKAKARMSGKYVVFVIDKLSDFYYDENEICQLIVNLAMNGLEAMETGGRLTLRACQEDSRIVVTIEDQGKGIPPEIADKIATPFFSTKESCSGLGLSICYSIAARHQASIEISSGDTGTVIYVCFELKQAGENAKAIL